MACCLSGEVDNRTFLTCYEMVLMFLVGFSCVGMSPTGTFSWSVLSLNLNNHIFRHALPNISWALIYTLYIGGF